MSSARQCSITKLDLVYTLYLLDQYNWFLYCCYRLLTTVCSCQTYDNYLSLILHATYFLVSLRFPSSVPYYKGFFALKTHNHVWLVAQEKFLWLQMSFYILHLCILLSTCDNVSFFFFLQNRCFQKTWDRKSTDSCYLISCLYILQRLHSIGKLVLEARLGHRVVCPEASVHIEGFLL